MSDYVIDGTRVYKRKEYLAMILALAAGRMVTV
jgi:hypothetical protein